MDEFGFGQSIRKLPENLETMLFYETYIEESNINRKPFIWCLDKIVINFAPIQWVSCVLGKVYENCPKIKDKCYFTKPTSKSVISTRKHLFGQS